MSSQLTEAARLRHSCSVGLEVSSSSTGTRDAATPVTDPDGRARGGCWCHLRRKLSEARTTEGYDADIGIGKLRPLFRVEHEATAIEIVGTPKHLELRLSDVSPPSTNS
jgi:hypothetical protein